jgi:hypothetical protein
MIFENAGPGIEAAIKGAFGQLGRSVEIRAGSFQSISRDPAAIANDAVASVKAVLRKALQDAADSSGKVNVKATGTTVEGSAASVSLDTVVGKLETNLGGSWGNIIEPNELASKLVTFKTKTWINWNNSNAVSVDDDELVAFTQFAISDYYDANVLLSSVTGPMASVTKTTRVFVTNASELAGEVFGGAGAKGVAPNVEAQGAVLGSAETVDAVVAKCDEFVDRLPSSAQASAAALQRGNHVVAYIRSSYSASNGNTYSSATEAFKADLQANGADTTLLRVVEIQ